MTKEPKDKTTKKKTKKKTKRHLNGGGRVSSTAYAAVTAYVGPDAQVLGYASVS